MRQWRAVLAAFDMAAERCRVAAPSPSRRHYLEMGRFTWLAFLARQADPSLRKISAASSGGRPRISRPDDEANIHTLLERVAGKAE